MNKSTGKNPDLFAETTMTFGEHLEELRYRLFLALAGLALGFALGLFVGGPTVDIIQRPLQQALETYYEKQSVGEVWANRDQLAEAGYHVPDSRGEVEDILEKKRLMFQQVHVDPGEILRALKKSDPTLFGDTPVPEKAEPGLLANLEPLYVWYPVEDEVRVTSLSAHEPFIIYVKASLLVGALLASPWMFYQVWAFVAAGLYPHEKKYVHIFLPFSLLLFFAGAGLAFLFVFGPVLSFLFQFNSLLGIEQDIRISEWLGFVLMLPLGFGISFQLPLVMLFLERIGIFDVQVYLSKWRIAILVIFVLAMLLTPADPTSMLLMAGPLTLLYFGGIVLCKYLPRNRSPYEAWDK